MGELPLRGAARYKEEAEGGSSRCTGLPDLGRDEEAAFGESVRCAGLLAGGKDKATSGGAPYARGCSI